MSKKVDLLEDAFYIAKIMVKIAVFFLVGIPRLVFVPGTNLE